MHELNEKLRDKSGRRSFGGVFSIAAKPRNVKNS